MQQLRAGSDCLHVSKSGSGNSKRKSEIKIRSGLRIEMIKTPAIFTPEYGGIARAFIDFVSVQVGVYMDACSGFAKNKSVVERQIHRDVRPDGTKRGKKGAPRVMMTAVEDPTQPDVLMHRIVLVTSFL